MLQSWEVRPPCMGGPGQEEASRGLKNPHPGGQAGQKTERRRGQQEPEQARRPARRAAAPRGATSGDRRRRRMGRWWPGARRSRGGFAGGQVLLAASILSSCFLLSEGQSEITAIVEPPTPQVGQSVSLKLENLPTTPLICRWYRGENDERNRIVSYRFGTSEIAQGPAYSGRETVDSNCSLHITNLRSNDSANYTVIVDNFPSPLTGRVNLKVLEKLSPPILSPAKHAAVENENVTLYCDISSSSEFNISWFKNNQPISTSLNISGYQKNLTLLDFTKSDAGNYTCVASNQISNGTSNPSEITLAYGPYITMKPSGVKNLKLGSKLDLQCTVYSNPAAQLRWFFNGTDQNVTTNTFIINSVTSNDEGNYTCQATNDVTHFVVAASVIVTVSNEGGGGGNGGLSSGAIAGIVIGCLAGVILIAGLIYFLYTRTSCGLKRTYSIPP